jgi:putative restriction endonuclease
MSAYQRPCAIPGSRIKPVLPAAHKDGGIHRVDNGMLLRRDVHKLFDDGYLDVDNRFRLGVSSCLKLRFGNGVESRAGTRRARDLDACVPHATTRARSLTWHKDTVFKST